MAIPTTQKDMEILYLRYLSCQQPKDITSKDRAFAMKLIAEAAESAKREIALYKSFRSPIFFGELRKGNK